MAKRLLRQWRDSEVDVHSKTDLRRLQQVSEAAGRAFGLVEDPVDKLVTASMHIFAEYHLLAHEKQDWALAKREAQAMLRNYIMDEMPKPLATACKALYRSGWRRRLTGGNKQKAAELISAFIDVNNSVHSLHPQNANEQHPKFPDTLKNTALSMVAVPQYYSASWISSMNSKPLDLQTLSGHTDPVRCCSVFDHNTKVVSGSDDNTLKVWDLVSGKEIHTLVGNTKGAWCCTVFDQDTKVASGSSDWTLKVWDLVSGKEIHSLSGHRGIVWCCSVFDHDTKVVSGSGDNTLKVWDLVSGKEIQSLSGHTGTVWCCSVFDHDTKVVSGSSDNTLKVWDLVSGKEIHTLSGHMGTVMCCSVFDRHTKVVSGSCDNTLKVWALPPVR